MQLWLSDQAERTSFQTAGAANSLKGAAMLNCPLRMRLHEFDSGDADGRILELLEAEHDGHP